VAAERWVFSSFAERARAEGWDFHSLPVGHDAQVLAPEQLTAMLEAIASEDNVAGG
jgi:hypothetical protein